MGGERGDFMSKPRFLAEHAVFVICRKKSGEILLEQRSGTKYLDEFWDFPSGHVEYGEDLHTAAARELREETSLIVDPEDLKLVHIEQFFVDINYVDFTFLAEKFSGEPKIMEPDKCSGLKWFAIKDFPKKLTNNVRQNLLADFSSELTYSVTDKNNYEKLLKGGK